MPKNYTIRAGFSFVCANNEVKVGGDTIELEDDVAANHAHKLELVDEKTGAKAEKQPKPTAQAASADAPAASTGDTQA